MDVIFTFLYVLSVHAILGVICPMYCKMYNPKQEIDWF